MTKITYKHIRKSLNFDFQPQFFIRQVGTDLLLLATMFALFQTTFAVINVFLIPAFMFRQFSILHEAVHGLAHPNSKINDALGVISGAFCLTPYATWKAAHLKHHYWTGNLNQDPTFAILKQYEQFSALKKNLIEFTWRKGLPLLGFLQHLGFWVFTFKNTATFKNVFSSVMVIALYAAVLSQTNLANAVISIIGICLYFRAYEEMIVPQHVGMYSDDEIEHHPSAWDQQEITRSWPLASGLERYVVLNMNYHTEHHLFPDLPWHQLDNAHQLLLQENEPLNLISLKWMSEQRQRPFAEVIIPIPSRKKNAA